MASNLGGFMNNSQFIASRLALTVGLLLSTQALGQTAPARPATKAPARAVAPAANSAQVSPPGTASFAPEQAAAPVQAAPAQQVAPPPAYAPAAAPPPPMAPVPGQTYIVIDPATGQPMTAMTYSPAMRQRPAVLPYLEGAPVPRGYMVEEYHPRGLIIGGAVTLGVLYSLSLAVAASNNFNTANGWLAVPVVGPFAWLATRKTPPCNNSMYSYSCSDDSGNRAAVVLDGMGQVAGAALLIAGLAITRKHLLLVDPNETVVAPYATSTSAGLNLLGRF
jgi:hypothetical protein